MARGPKVVLVTSALNFAYTDFVTRERWDLVVDGRAYADADGLHLGQDDLSIQDARRIVGPDALVATEQAALRDPQIEALLALWADPGRASAQVKRLAQAHAAELEAKIAEMQAMQRTLLDLARHCHGNQRPDCPILDDLAR